MRAEMAEREAPLRYPIRGTFPACCASAEPQSAKTMTLSARAMISFLMLFSLRLFTALDTRPSSLNHLIRPRQHVRRNSHTHFLCRLQIDHELEFRRLLHGKVCWLGTFQDFIHIRCSPAVQVRNTNAVAHKPTHIHKFFPVIYRRDPTY